MKDEIPAEIKKNVNAMFRHYVNTGVIPQSAKTYLNNKFYNRMMMMSLMDILKNSDDKSLGSKVRMFHNGMKAANNVGWPENYVYNPRIKNAADEDTKDIVNAYNKFIDQGASGYDDGKMFDDKQLVAIMKYSNPENDLSLRRFVKAIKDRKEREGSSDSAADEFSRAFDRFENRKMGEIEELHLVD